MIIGLKHLDSLNTLIQHRPISDSQVTQNLQFVWSSGPSRHWSWDNKFVHDIIKCSGFLHIVWWPRKFKSYQWVVATQMSKKITQKLTHKITSQTPLRKTVFQNQRRNIFRCPGKTTIKDRSSTNLWGQNNHPASVWSNPRPTRAYRAWRLSHPPYRLHHPYTRAPPVDESPTMKQLIMTTNTVFHCLYYTHLIRK